MRILHCIPSMAGGGAERQLAYLAGELPALGWDAHVALVSEGPNLTRLLTAGATVHRLRARGNHDPRILWQLGGLMHRLRPAIAQVWLVQMEVVGGLAASALGIPWVLSEQNSLPAYPRTLKNRLRVAVASRAHAVVSNSMAGDAYWRDRVDGRMARYVIGNAVPLDEIDAQGSREASGSTLEPGRRVVLFVGRFSPQKNLQTLVAALRILLARPETVAVLCGDGPLQGRVAGWIAEAGLTERVRLPGYVADVWRWMKRADVLVSPSLFEGHPNVVLEAMACGCPLVVSDIPTHREFLDESCAVLVAPRDPAALAEAILGVLTAPDAAARRSARARAMVARYSVPAMARQYDRVYREVLARRHRRREQT